MDVEFSPTGEELVSASYVSNSLYLLIFEVANHYLQDRTVRIWSRDKGQSRDIYHTKRMQRYVLLDLVVSQTTNKTSGSSAPAGQWIPNTSLAAVTTYVSF